MRGCLLALETVTGYLEQQETKATEFMESNQDKRLISSYQKGIADEEMDGTT